MIIIIRAKKNECPVCTFTALCNRSLIVTLMQDIWEFHGSANTREMFV